MPFVGAGSCDGGVHSLVILFLGGHHLYMYLCVSFHPSRFHPDSIQIPSFRLYERKNHKMVEKGVHAVPTLRNRVVIFIGFIGFIGLLVLFVLFVLFVLLVLLVGFKVPLLRFGRRRKYKISDGRTDKVTTSILELLITSKNPYSTLFRYP
jgi:hypothetical protein